MHYALALPELDGPSLLEEVVAEAAPEVIQNGLIVNWESNWKGRGYDSAILSAPIEIVSNGSAQRYYAGVVVIRKDQTQRFYTHEVVLQKEDGTHVVQTGVLNNQYLPGDALHLPIKSILDQINNVNTSEKTSREQRELADGETKFSLKRTSALNQDTQLLLEGEDVQVDAQSVQAYARDALRADCRQNRGRRVRRSGAKKCPSLRRACPDPRVSR